MYSRLVIIGAGGHGKVIADIALKNKIQNIVFVDDNINGECMNFPIIGNAEILQQLDDGRTGFIIAIGNNKIRNIFSETYNLPWVSLIHPSAQIGSHVHIECGTVVMAGAIINANTLIGSHCIINTCAVIEHDNIIENTVHISPNAALAGNVYIGKETHVGIGATVINNLKICANCQIGAGAVVIHDITEPGTYVGIPAHKLN